LKPAEQLVLSDANLSRFVDGLFSNRRLDSALRDVRTDLPLESSFRNPRVLRALAACKAGVPQERIASLLDWKEFESFCADALRESGCEVEENIYLRKPRAQVDLLAKGLFFTLVVDCKHWSRQLGLSSLGRCAAAQIRRARLLRAQRGVSLPMVAVVLTLTESQERFVNGAAIVPIFALRSFVDGLPSYEELLELI
jgi:Restriction endonuclease